ncbi:MAG: ABC transporter substrate-binding protein [Lachnospiraceae bacterium]|nr:ABC transporter substrate-binding protein [Lachnospiraceae bacterium]
MGRLKGAVLLTAGLAAMLLLGGCGGEKESLTVINYGMYLEESVIEGFENETGIEIKYEEAPTPEEMYTKYKSGAIEYDLLCTSEYMLQKLMDEGELVKVDFKQMEHYDNISEEFWDFVRSFDPENAYVMPYFWGTVGLLYDSEKTNGPLHSWDVLFDGSYAGDFIMPNSMRDAYMIALKYLGYSLNTTDEKELREAQELLLTQKPDVSAYLVDEARDEVLAGNAAIAAVYSGEAYYAYAEDPRFQYCIPDEGSNLWIDCFAVTKQCRNTENALKFLDYLCREDNARMNYDYVKYASPFKSMIESYGEEEKNSDAINPSPEKINNCEIFAPLPQETTDLMGELWKELKAQ